MKFPSRRVFWFTALFLLSAACCVAAQDYLVKRPLIGPEVFVGKDGTAQTAVRDFGVSEPAPLYQMHVQIGSSGGEHFVSDAMIRLNGAVVLHEKGFQEDVRSFEFPVILQANNRLEVKLNGMPASHLTVSIDGFYYRHDIETSGARATESPGDCEDGDAPGDAPENSQ